MSLINLKIAFIGSLPFLFWRHLVFGFGALCSESLCIYRVVFGDFRWRSRLFDRAIPLLL